MNILISINGEDVTALCRLADTRISFDSSKRITTANITVMAAAFSERARYDAAHYDQNRYSIALRETYRVVIVDGRDGTTVLFTGQLFSFEMDQSDTAQLPVFFKCELNDDAAWLDRSVCWGGFTLALPASDQAIIQQLVAQFCPQIDATQFVQQLVPVIQAFDWMTKTCRQVLDDLCSLSMGEWKVNTAAQLVYGPIGDAPPAPFGLSTSADNVATFPVNVSGYRHDYNNPVTRAYVRGGVDPATGLAIQASYQDPVAAATYGDFEAGLVDTQIATAWDAALRAKSMVLQNAYPIESGNFTIRRDGLAVGMLVHIVEETLGLDGDYIIRQIVMQWEDPWSVRYDCQFGAAQPDLESLLRLLAQRASWQTANPPGGGTPGAGTVTDSSIASPGLSAASISSVNASSIVGQVQAGQIGSVNAASIAGTIQAGQIGSVNATVLQGAIQAGQIGSVNATTIQGVVVSSQLAEGIINDLGKFTTTLRPVPMLNAFPSLPSNSYLAGTFFYYVPDGHFYQINPNGLGWTQNDNPAGALTTFYHIGAISAASIVGLIVAAQIQTITAGQITGQVQASQIGAVNASTIVGQVQASQIASVNATAIQGSITANQISTVNAGSISGTIQGSQIANIQANSITIGQLTDTQIQTVNASKLIVGTVQGYTVTVQDSSNQPIGLIGNLGSAYGGWFKVFGAGGTGYADAVVRTDPGGNLTITNATFTVTNANGTQLLTGTQVFDSTYQSVALTVQGGSDKASLVSRGLIAYGGGSAVATVTRSASSSTTGEIVVYRSGSIAIWLDGNTGVTRSDGGFQVLSNLGKSTTFNAVDGASLQFTLGILTAYTAANISKVTQQLNVSKPSGVSGWYEMYFNNGLLSGVVEH